MDAHAQQQKAFLFFRMLVIEELNCEVIVKNALCFLKRNLMLLQISRRFARMPLKLNHMYIVCKPFAGPQVRRKALSVHDMLIAATAIEHQLMLATRNVRDFTRCGVQVVNPFDGQNQDSPH